LVRDNVVDLAIRNPDILQFLVTEAAKIVAQPLPSPPLLKSSPEIPESAAMASLQYGRSGQARRLGKRAHRNILEWPVSTRRICRDSTRLA